MHLVGIEIGGTKLQVVAGNDVGSIVERHRFTVNPASGGAGIRSQIASTLPALLQRLHPVAVGVGFGGPVDWQTGRICCSHQVTGWSEFDLRSWLHERTSLPVAVDNDGNTGALGEARHGSGRGSNPVFYVTLGSGVGGGLVVDGRIYHGAKPGEAEIGHIRLDRTGTLLEKRCSGWAVDQRIRNAIVQEPNTALGQLCAGSPGCEARHLTAALTAHDELATRLLNETVDDLAFGLSHVVNLIHPEIIILGGGLSLLGEPLRSRVQDRLPRYVMDSFLPGPRVALAELREDSVPVGALELARDVMAPGSTRIANAF
ncbi:MAG: ROK family protein [Pedosphaera sp.]|nr:ROK family protein [Pedosphaera sp.]